MVDLKVHMGKKPKTSTTLQKCAGTTIQKKRKTRKDSRQAGEGGGECGASLAENQLEIKMEDVIISTRIRHRFTPLFIHQHCACATECFSAEDERVYGLNLFLLYPLLSLTVTYFFYPSSPFSPPPPTHLLHKNNHPKTAQKCAGK